MQRKTKMVDVVQSVRTSDCGSEGRRFEPDLPPSLQKRMCLFERILFFMCFPFVLLALNSPLQSLAEGQRGRVWAVFPPWKCLSSKKPVGNVATVMSGTSLCPLSGRCLFGIVWWIWWRYFVVMEPYCLFGKGNVSKRNDFCFDLFCFVWDNLLLCCGKTIFCALWDKMK